ncbi:MAG TPA: hypothetical protein VN605_05390, partial [Thermoanaerobaculia bacterium]|nr:hypothetical protein [Thermoanaerobaculia bacterium]
PAAIEKIRGLVGEWSGTYEWSGARTDKGEMNAVYSLTGNGSAVIESLSVGSEPSMSSIYHLDLDDLRVTHYCAARNQPRLRARTIDLPKGLLEFEFVDATNMRSADAPHVHGLELHFDADDRLTIVFLFRSGAQVSRETILLHRGKRQGAAA